MKIKRLIIRNIAAIESADIDFEKDLRSAASEDDQSLFMISGDTGSGKSVILDCITMALYKTTPRVRGASNSKNNEFTTTEGESLRVAALEQYTRIGISHKDPCYAELQFEGNDGVTYRARLSLGMKRGRKGNQGSLLHRKPEWILEPEGGTVLTRDADILPVIDKAIGLSYEQFGRMAMLAQGQFASFLTGDKSQREAILEQLTDTARFSRYGEAIKALTSRARKSLEIIQTQYSTESNHLLSAEELEKLTADYTDTSTRLEINRSQLDAANQRLHQVEDYHSSLQRRKSYEHDINQLIEEESGRSYQDRIKLVTQWDATTEIRTYIPVLDESEQKITRLEKLFQDHKDTFARLDSDLIARNIEITKLSEETDDIRHILEENKLFADLFHEAGKVEEKLNAFLRDIAEKEVIEETIKIIDTTIPDIEKARAEAQRAAEEILSALASQDKILEKYQEEITVLDGAGITKRLTSMSQLSGDLTASRHIVADYERVYSEQSQLKDRLEEKSNLLRTSADKLEKSKREQQDARQKYDQALSLLTTMQCGVDEYLTNLRKEMIRTRATHCPLCGSATDDLHIDDQLRNLLTPLEEQRESAAQELAAAARHADEMNASFAAQQGEFKVLETQSANNQKSLLELLAMLKKGCQYSLDDERLRESDLEGDLADDFKDEIKKLPDNQLVELSVIHNLDTIVARCLQRLENEKASMHKKQEELHRLQEKVTLATVSRKQLDKNRHTAEKKLQEVSTELDRNIQRRATAVERLTELSQRIINEESVLDGLLHNFRQDWKNNIQSVIESLSSESRQFLNTEKALDRGLALLDRLLTEVRTISITRDMLLSLYPEWRGERTPSLFRGEDILRQWTTLGNAIERDRSALAEAIEKQEKAISAVSQYQEREGMTLDDLRLIMTKEKELSEARKYLTDHAGEIKSRRDMLNETRQKIEELKQVLQQPGNNEEIGSPEDERLRIKTLTEENRRLSEQTTALRLRLDENKRISASLKELEEKVARSREIYEKWERIDRYFGGTKMRTLVQSHILRPLLENANIYLSMITDQYLLTCCDDNEQLSILVEDRYNRNQRRSVTVLSGGERFMISLALSLALSCLNRPGLNVDILFIDEGFGTLDEKNLNSVMDTLERLREIASQNGRRVGIISHREELMERIPLQIQVYRCGEGRSRVRIRKTI